MQLDPKTVYPRAGDATLCYLKNVIQSPNISVGDFTFYHDFADPAGFERNNVLYHYPVNGDRLIIGKFCSIACGAKFLFNAANHALQSLSTYPFPLFADWDESAKVAEAWDNRGDIVVGNDVWIGYEAVILAGVQVGDGAIIGARAVVTKDVLPYTIVGGAPARAIRKRFGDAEIEVLQRIRWWDWDIARIREGLPAIRRGDIGRLREIAAESG